MQTRIVFAAVITLFSSVSTGHAAGICPGQDVASHQGVVAFNSITDGQPGTPRTPQLTVIPFYDFSERQFHSEFSVSGVVAESGFWCQAQFELAAPTLAASEGVIDFEKSVTASWQQRWLIADGNQPTVSTLVSAQVPYDGHGEKTDILLTGIVARSTQWGAAYLNIFAESTNGTDFSAMDYGAVIGAKRIVSDSLALIADTVIHEGGSFALELSLERNYRDGLTLGPGLALSHSGDDPDGVDLSIGITLFKVFGGK
jgi:hypothetical protein